MVIIDCSASGRAYPDVSAQSVNVRDYPTSHLEQVYSPAVTQFEIAYGGKFYTIDGTSAATPVRLISLLYLPSIPLTPFPFRPSQASSAY